MFSKQLKSLLGNLKQAEEKLLSLLSSGTVAEEKLLEEAGLKEVEKLLSALANQTPKLVIKTKEIFKELHIVCHTFSFFISFFSSAIFLKVSP